jgi:F0F1-type ATP synthase gamma subunit
LDPAVDPPLPQRYNRDRQANITTSLVEIISGAAALVDE